MGMNMSARSGISIRGCTWRPRKRRRSGGAMPTISYGASLSRMLLPTIPGSAENLRRQTKSLRMTTFGAPRFSSDSVNHRPRCGWTLSVSKNPAVMRIAPSVSGWPEPVRFRVTARPANANDSKDRISFRRRVNCSGTIGNVSENLLIGNPWMPDWATITSLPDSGYASGLSTMEFTSVNIATLPPIPMARERIAATVKPGAERRLRYALRKSSSNMTPPTIQSPRTDLLVGNPPAKPEYAFRSIGYSIQPTQLAPAPNGAAYTADSWSANRRVRVDLFVTLVTSKCQIVGFSVRERFKDDGVHEPDHRNASTNSGAQEEDNRHVKPGAERRLWHAPCRFPIHIAPSRF